LSGGACAVKGCGVGEGVVKVKEGVDGKGWTTVNCESASEKRLWFGAVLWCVFFDETGGIASPVDSEACLAARGE